MTENEARKIIEKFCKDRIGFAKGKDMNDKELEVFCQFSEALNLSMSSLKEIQQYREIGTVEKYREARERQIPKKPNKRQVGTNILMSKIYYCPTCNKKLYDCAFKNGKLDYVSPGSRKSKFCEDCGQKLDWSEKDD